MGFWRAFGREMGRILMLPDTTTAQFSVTNPRPVDRLLYEMMHGTGAIPKAGRVEALSVPAVLRGRNLICNIATLPLFTIDAQHMPVERPLFEQIDPDVANEVTLAQTLEDLFFEGTSWWQITEFGDDGFPSAARHLDWHTVTVQPPTSQNHSPAPLPSGIDPRNAVVYVDGQPVPNELLIRFDSLNPGILNSAGRAIKRAIALDKTSGLYAENPRPLDYFSPTDQTADPVTDDQVRDIILLWRQARRAGSTAYIPAALTYHTVDTPTPADLQLIEQQKQVYLELANAMGLDAKDLNIPASTDTYQNVQDRRRDKINEVLSPYMTAITSRLSMNDVTPRGQNVRFDLDDYLRANTKERYEVYEIAQRIGVQTADEQREEENLPQLPAGQRQITSTPAQSPAQSSVPQPVNASRWVSVQLNDDNETGESLTFADLPSNVTFAVDIQRRTITGLAVPFNQVAVNRGRKFRFEKGSLEYADLSRVKLLRDHDRAQALGKTVELLETPDGYVAKFFVGRGVSGDTALALADDGVLDGLSVGVDIIDAVPDPNNRGALLVRRAILREVSLTAMPAFDDSRVTSVAASRDEGNPVTDPTPEPQAPTAPAGAPDMTAFFQAFSEWQAQQNVPQPEPTPQPEPRAVVNPTRAVTFVNEPTTYKFDRGGNFVQSEHLFSTDLRDAIRAGDLYGTDTGAGRRVMDFLQAQFAVISTDVNELNPTIQRPDMYVDQRDFRYPLWEAVSKGAPPNGVQPFAFPKFSSASGLVGDHTEGTEPTSGTFVTTSQTVTPTEISGKASITRSVWDMGGNPAVSTLIYRQMLRSWREGLESATATFLGTLTAATDINLGVAVVDENLANAWDIALAGLQFARGYDFSTFAVEQQLYNAFISAKDSTGRKLYPILGPTNTNGTAERRFRTLDLSGVVGIPAWALGSVSGSPNNSWLFDKETVHGWATAPQRLEFAGTAADGSYAPVAMVDLAVYGYKAFANSDIGGVRQVIYDNA